MRGWADSGLGQRGHSGPGPVATAEARGAADSGELENGLQEIGGSCTGAGLPPGEGEHPGILEPGGARRTHSGQGRPSVGIPWLSLAPDALRGNLDILTIQRIVRRCKLKKEDSNCGLEPSCASKCKPLMDGGGCPPAQIAARFVLSARYSHGPLCQSQEDPVTSEEPPHVTTHQASFQMHLA